MSKHTFPYKWYLKDGYPAKGMTKHNKKVFGTFVCGGGSTMGYKLAGYEHIGGVEIDPKVGDVYKANHKPKHFYLEDIRDFNKRNDLPKELYDLDLLDGSPPCSSFSMAGNREKDWGKKKVFREGQELQRLDDLVFEYVRTIKKLKPKVALLENVKGLIQGNAKAYAKKINKEFTKAGYRVQLFLLNAASMGVPQKRERVFFIGLRDDIKLDKLVLKFDEDGILFGEFAEDKNGKHITGKMLDLWSKRVITDKGLRTVSKRVNNNVLFFGTSLLHKNKVPYTLISQESSPLVHYDKPYNTTDFENKLIASFPLDYDFKKTGVKYLAGMSVPPVMTAQIANQIYLQWLSKI